MNLMGDVLKILIPLEREYGISLHGLPDNDLRLIKIRKILQFDSRGNQSKHSRYGRGENILYAGKLYEKGVPVDKICEIIHIKHGTLRNYLFFYKEKYNHDITVIVKRK